jgi:hypothetical protein
VRRPHLSTGAWIAGGLVAAAMLVPGIAYATSTVTQIVGKNGTTVAQVTPASQLQVTEVAPGSFFSKFASSDNAGSFDCDTLTTAPANQGVIVREIRATTFQGDSKDYVIFIAGADCVGSRIGEVNGGDADSNIDLSIDPGFSIPAGTPITYIVHDFSGNLQADLQVDGYLVPKGNVITTS